MGSPPTEIFGFLNNLIAQINLVAFIALIFTIWSFRKSISASTQDRLYSHYNEILKLFFQKPHLRSYFYENRVISDKTPEDEKAEIGILSEAILGLIEHAVLQNNILEKDAWNNCWYAYIKELITNSAELDKFYSDNKHIYTKQMQKTIYTIKKDCVKSKS